MDKNPRRNDAPPSHEHQRVEVAGDGGVIGESERREGVAQAGMGEEAAGSEDLCEKPEDWIGLEVDGEGVGEREEQVVAENSGDGLAVEYKAGEGRAVNENEGFPEGVGVGSGSIEEQVVICGAGEEEDNKNDEKVGNIVEKEVVSGTENELVDREVVDSRKDMEVGDVGVVMAELPDELVVPEEREGKDLVEDENVVDAQRNIAMPEVMELSAVEEMVECNELVKDANLVEPSRNTAVPEVVELKAVEEIGEAKELVKDANVVETSRTTAMAEVADLKVVEEIGEGKELVEDANVVETSKNTAMPEVMENKVVEETVDVKQLADDDADVAEAPEKMLMHWATEDKTISGVLTDEGLAVDAYVAQTTGKTTNHKATKDTSVETVVEAKESLEDAVVAKRPEDMVMLEGTEDPAVAEVEDNELADDATATKEPEDTAIHRTAEGMADNKLMVEELAGDADVAKAPTDTAVSDATSDTAAAETVEVDKLAEDVIAVDTCMTDVSEDIEMAGEVETDVFEEGGKAVAGKRKRGRPSNKTSTKKKTEEDVCFICFDGGDLVLCDRRGCPKAYHPTCVNRDKAFFQSKGQWNCGWHLCTVCQKGACYTCYTCTFSLCKGCIKDAVILCIRKNKGFCETCMKTIMLIEENNQQNKEQAQVNFDDKSSWEYLFKDYWLELKGRLSITFNELAEARNPWNGIAGGRDLATDELYDPNSIAVTSSEHNSENVEVSNAKRKKANKRLKAGAGQENSAGAKMEIDSGRPSPDASSEWASKELLEFVMHMKNGDKSVLSQFDVQALLLDYIKRNKLRDPRRKSQIICDSMLQYLFGKQRVGHFEMLKLLESHFLIKDDPQANDLRGSVVATETSQLEVDGSSNALTKTNKDKKRKNRKKGDGRLAQTNLDDYAAIDIHNINLIYLRRNLVEELLEDVECFYEKVVGSFVRIRIFGSNQKQDIYRLVQVLGTSKTTEPYKVGKKMTDIVLEILNLNKTEVISIDVISNQDFTEDECKRLRQSIKCGLIDRLTVGDILEKATALQAVRVNDWIQAETMRLSHLRDRASDLGRRKELRECVEKLQLLKTPEEREHRLEELPEVHADPNMDPSHESEEDEDKEDDKRQETISRPKGNSFNKKVREAPSPHNDFLTSGDPWGENRNYTSFNRDLTRNLSAKGLWSKSGENNSGENLNKSTWNQGREKELQQSMNGENPKVVSASQSNAGYTYTGDMLESASSVLSEYSPVRSSAEVSVKVNESEKLWHYRDPSGKIQGPFSISQLRKWNNTGYFPADLRIWKTTEKQEDSMLLADALTGKFQREPMVLDRSGPKTPTVDSRHLPSAYSGKTYDLSAQQLKEGQGEETLRSGSETCISRTVTRWSSDLNRREDLTNLPSPTPLSNEFRVQSYKTNVNSSSLSTRPEGSSLEANPFSAGNVVLQHSPAAISVTDRGPHASSPLGLTSMRASSRIDDPNMLKMSPTPGSEESTLQMRSRPNMVDDSHKALVNLSMLQAGDACTAANMGPHMKNADGSLQNLFISAGGNNLPAVSQGFVDASSQNIGASSPNIMPLKPSAYGHWGSASSNISGSYAIPKRSGVPQSESWGSSVNNNQTNIQPIGTSILPRFMGVADNTGVIPGRGPENPSTGWGQMPMAGNSTEDWGGPHPANPNMNWGAPGQGPAHGTANPSWAAHGQAPATGNTIPGWIPGNQGPVSVTVNSNRHLHGQVLPPANANSGWPASTEYLGRRGTDQNSNRPSFPSERDMGSHGGDAYGRNRFSQGVDAAYGRDRFSHGGDAPYCRDRVSHGHDPAYSRDRASHGDNGGRPWNRQASVHNGGGEVTRSFPRGREVCKFHENGHCKKGASCNYLHT